MKLAYSILIFIIFSSSSFAQKYPQFSENGDTVWVSDKVKFAVGEDIKLGTGSTDFGEFNYIRESSLSWNAINNGGQKTIKRMPNSASGTKFRIKRIKDYGNEKRGYVTYLILGGGNIVNYECDIMQAVKAGEIDCEGCDELKKRNAPMIINNVPSVADEIAKLKKLKDDGAITEEEYQTQKTKLLNK